MTEFSITWSPDSNGTIRVRRRYGTRSERWTLQHQTDHYVVVRHKGTSYYDRGSHWIPGAVEVYEYRGRRGGRLARHAVWRVKADRSWRTQVKAAIAKANELEAGWEAMNAAREAKALEAKKLEAEEIRRETATAEAAVTIAASSPALLALIQEAREAARDRRLQEADVEHILVRAVRRAVGSKR